MKMGVLYDMIRHDIDLAASTPDPKVKRVITRDVMRKMIGKAVDSVDDRMGQLTYDNLFWNRVAVDIGQGLIRSLGWNLGVLRTAASGTVDFSKQIAEGLTGSRPRMTHRMAYLAALPMMAALIGSILMYLMTGKRPETLKDAYFPRTGEKDEYGKEKRLSLPMYSKDAAAYMHDPGQTLMHKVHPEIGMVADMLQNRDFYGTEIRNADDPFIKQLEDTGAYMAKQVTPLGIRNAQQGSTAKAKILPFIGLTPAPKWMEQSKAEQLAAELTAKKMGDTTVTQETRATIDLKNQIERELRTDLKKGYDDLNTAMVEGKLNNEQAKAVVKRSQTTQLDSRVLGLDVASALKVWNVATPQERTALMPIIAEKIKNSKMNLADKQAALKQIGLM
jgi:hypothetical protein